MKRKIKARAKQKKVFLILMGGGGHARVLKDILQNEPGVQLLGYTDLKPNSLIGFRYLGDDGVLGNFVKKDVRLVNAVGSVRLPEVRRKIFEKGKALGFQFHSVIHPRATIASDVFSGEGAQVMASAVINPGAHIAENALINTGAMVDHDCQIGAHTHVAPGVTMSGNVFIGFGCHIGAGATIIHGISIGSETLIGAGSVVIKDIPGGVTAYGVPAVVVAEKNSSRGSSSVTRRRLSASKVGETSPKSKGFGGLITGHKVTFLQGKP